jgi:hypothetical protein
VRVWRRVVSPILGLWRLDLPLRRSILIGEGSVRLGEPLEQDDIIF